ncbi:hypothetical protein K2173_022696 [Erythroxylum novogranatense]|uniref:Myb/SANT-like domain-containing protein n=1 Tax=Erythroxylum novogranatense TaxID=1862640 RepID=A0AAV8TNR3_9ROSI|nr:hypothetical protein K2173_022696 [Erythroxylum novogranatense]
MSIPSQDIQGGDKLKKRIKAKWNDRTLEILIKIFVEETLAGNRPNGHFNKIGWKNIVSKFTHETKKNYEYKQFKNKWDRLKKDWQLWTNLVGKKIGLGWDPTCSIPLPQDPNPISMENPEATKFRTKRLKHIEQMNILFKDVAAIGEGAWAPFSGFVPNDAYLTCRESVVDIDLDDDLLEDFAVNPKIENINNEIGSSTPTLGTFTKGKGKKRKKHDTRIGAIERLCNHLDRIYDAVESRTSMSYGYNIVEALNILRSINEIERRGELFMLATKLFFKKENREMFIELKDVDLQIEWLKKMK